jgi:hypothetical protein
MRRIIMLAAVLSLGAIALPHDINGHSPSAPGWAKCTGSKYCRACKNCRYCKHCAEDGGPAASVKNSRRYFVSFFVRRLSH